MAQLGNQNARRGREWRDALRRARVQLENERKLDRGQLLVDIGRKVHDLALDGDFDAIREIGNREDGKPIQATEIEVKQTAELTLKGFVANVGYDNTLKLLKLAGAENLIPILKQIVNEKEPIEGECELE